MNTRALYALPVLLALVGCNESQPKTAAPAAKPQPAALPTTPSAERMDGSGFMAIILKARRPIPQQLADLKGLAAWGEAHGLKGTPFFFVYDGPCDGGPNGWISDAGLMLPAAPAPGFDAGPYELREFTPPAARVIRAVSPKTGISSMRLACDLIRGSETEFYKAAIRKVLADKPDRMEAALANYHYIAPAMNLVVPHGMKNFTLDEAVTLEVRIPHYEIDHKGPKMPEPYVAPPKPVASAPASAPAPAPASSPAAKPKRKTPLRPKNKPAAVPASAPTAH